MVLKEPLPLFLKTVRAAAAEGALVLCSDVTLPSAQLLDPESPALTVTA